MKCRLGTIRVELPWGSVQYFAHLEPLLDSLEPRKYGRSLAPSCAVKEVLEEEVIPVRRIWRRELVIMMQSRGGVHIENSPE